MNITLEVLEAKREKYLADYYALQGAIQTIDDLIALAKQPENNALPEPQAQEQL